jgi:hypothetical protein
MVFENNIVVGLEDPEYIKLTADPLLAAPGTDETGINMTDPARLSGYRLCKGSPAVGTGREGDNEALADFWGKATMKPWPISGARQSTVLTSAPLAAMARAATRNE